MPDPEELAQATFISLLAEVVAITLFCGMVALWAGIGSGL